MEICSIKKCTGCGACAQVCPKEAIEMKQDDRGFYHPNIDDEECIECGKCTRTCHVNSTNDFNEVKSKYLFRHSDKEVRLTSSSGAAFTAIANVILKNGGMIFGAEFNGDFVVQHNGYDSLDKVKRFCTSKYVQSNTLDVYKRVFEQLKNQRKVLFSGTPCQVAGLKKYLESNNCSLENLITLDFICHGAATPKFWDDCLKRYENKYGAKATAVNFRGKPRPGKVQNLSIEFENGKKFIAPSANLEIYFYHFLKNFIIRESCFECKYSRSERVSDISMGDCFKTSGSLAYLSDGMGLSQLMANTDKGKAVLDYICEYGEMVEVDKNEYMQPNLKHPTPRPEGYDDFWNAYLQRGFNGAIQVSGFTNIKNRIKYIILCAAYYLKIDAKLKKIARKIKK